MAQTTHLTRWVFKTALVLGMLAGSTSIVSAAAPIVMATQSYTEQHALSAMTTLYLNKKGFQIEPKTNIATTISRNAMINKQINMTWEYTGTSLIIFNHINKPMSSEEDWQTVKNLDARLGLVWLNPAPMNDTYAFAMQRKRAEKEHIDTLSQLVAKIEKVRREDPDHNWTLGLDLEFAGRADGLKLLQKVYNMPLDRPQIRQMDPGLVYTTDGRVKGFDLKVLKDDKGFFPSYAVTPVLTQETQDSPPGWKRR